MNMTMKQLNFKFVACLFMLLFSLPSVAQKAPIEVPAEAPNDSPAEIYEQRVTKYRDFWSYLIPRYAKLQYAGGMGIVSAGIGWDYGKNRQWETDLMIGVIPRYSSTNAKGTLTLKENFTPWKISLGSQWAFQPLETGLYFNTVFCSKFWTREPSKYPSSYYGFSTKIRAYIFVGQRWQYNIPNSKHKYARSISAYYELSSCDLYIVSAAVNSYLKPCDYLRLSFGLKFQFL